MDAIDWTSWKVKRALHAAQFCRFRSFRGTDQKHPVIGLRAKPAPDREPNKSTRLILSQQKSEPRRTVSG
jgi:hypothetical protein